MSKEQRWQADEFRGRGIKSGVQMQGAGVNQAATKKSNDDLGFIGKTLACLLGLIFLASPFVITWTLTPGWIKYPLLYASRYQVDPRLVHASKMPSDCEWGHAPIGDKACHYERHAITTKNNMGRVTEVYVFWDKIQD